MSAVEAPVQWLSLANEIATENLGARLARALPATAAPLVLYLHGELGAGKTTLVRGLLRALGEHGAVRSPTYSLVAEYLLAGQRFLHLDLYRLSSPDELAGLGLADQLPGSRLWLVEWPEHGQGRGLPPPDLHVFLEPDGAARRACLKMVSAQGGCWVAALATDSA